MPLDSSPARLAFETALRESEPGFETFFLARFYGLEFSYLDAACIVRFPVRRPPPRRGVCGSQRRPKNNQHAELKNTENN